MIRTVIIGGGYWGQNLIRNFTLNQKFQVIHLVEKDHSRHKVLEEIYGVPCSTDLNPEILSSKINLIVIATPPDTHFDLIQAAISHCDAILVAKPCGSTLNEAIQIDNLSVIHDTPIYVDFTYEFSPLFDYLRRRVSSSDEYDYEFTSYRTALGKFQNSVSVLGDLAIHDVYILLRLLDFQKPLFAKALAEQTLDNAFCLLRWGNGVKAWIHVSWKAPKKIRHFGMISKSQAIVVEEMNLENSIQIVDLEKHDLDSPPLNIPEFSWRGIGIKKGSSWSPDVPRVESLKIEIELLGQILRGEEVSKDREMFFPMSKHAVSCWEVVQMLEESLDEKTICK